MTSTVMTRKGQITVPAELRRALHLEVGDRLNVVRDGNGFRVEPVGDVVARTAGMLRAYAKTPHPTIAEEKEAAEEAIALDVVERMNR